MLDANHTLRNSVNRAVFMYRSESHVIEYVTCLIRRNSFAISASSVYEGIKVRNMKFFVMKFDRAHFSDVKTKVFSHFAYGDMVTCL